MKVIDIMQKVANKEIFKFRIDGVNYYVDKSNYICEEDGDKVEWYIDDEWLNMNAEIIEEDKKIEKYDTGLTNGRYTEDSIKTGLDTDTTIENIIINMGIEITLVKEKMFEIIDKINNMEVK